jgi:DNA methylase
VSLVAGRQETRTHAHDSTMPNNSETRMKQLGLDLDLPTSVHQLMKPAGYKGLYGFHKYWGKKPAETVSFLVEQLSEAGEVVFDPFLGSGAIAREASLRGRRVIASDLNPAAIDLASLVADPPPATETQRALRDLTSRVRPNIDRSYPLPDGAIATHYLWHGNELRQVWTKGIQGSLRIELPPTAADLAGAERFRDYEPKALRPLRIFRNSRINSPGDMQWHDLFTGRALRNLELLRDAILEILNPRARHALLMALTASSGQMSKMVFAIEKRGKTSGARGNGRVEVGSWVIGFWRPELHFEVNVWNCFENKARALLRGLQSAAEAGHSPRMSAKALDVVEGRADVSLVNADATDLLATLPEGSVDFLVTDPPHGDRIPYLELSEIWNAILGRSPLFEQEIVVSDAAERGQTSEHYAERMKLVFRLAGRALSPNGRLAIMFNSRSVEEWADLVSATEAGSLAFCGCFPMAYSARSVVQDNRSGALKHDHVLLFVPSRSPDQGKAVSARLRTLPHWSDQIPKIGAL